MKTGGPTSRPHGARHGNAIDSQGVGSAIIVAATLISISAPVFAVDATCSTSAPSKFQPKTKLEDLLKTQA